MNLNVAVNKCLCQLNENVERHVQRYKKNEKFNENGKMVEN